MTTYQFKWHLSPENDFYSKLKSLICLILSYFCLQMLQEVGFQAGQHEVLAEAFSKEVYKQLLEQAKQLKEVRRKNMKESEKIINDLNSAFKSMQSSKDKFRRAFDDQEKASSAFSKANADGAVSRNEVEKLRLSHSNKTSVCDSMKHNYADQLVKTNAFRQRYYYELLPGVLDELQALEQRRIELIRHGILSCIAKEREVSTISCHILYFLLLFVTFCYFLLLFGAFWCLLVPFWHLSVSQAKLPYFEGIFKL